MTITLIHRTGKKLVERNIVKYTQDADYITVYYDPAINPLVRYEKFPVRAYGVEAFRIGKIEVEA